MSTQPHAAGSSVELRMAGAADAPLLARVHAAAFGGKAWDADAIADVLKVEGTEAMLALANGVPAGMIIYRMLWGDGEILTLGVAPAHRRRGMGGRLLATAMNAMVMQGANRVFLEVAEDNAAAIALYESMGFERLGRRPNYYLQEDGRCVDALLMARIFGGGCGG